MSTEPTDIDHETEPLLQSLKADLPALETLLEEADSQWGFEDPFYRLYHQSWKVFGEAFFHAKTFLALAVRYAKALDHAPRLLPSGWAAVLYLYNVR